MNGLVRGPLLLGVHGHGSVPLKSGPSPYRDFTKLMLAPVMLIDSQPVNAVGLCRANYWPRVGRAASGETDPSEGLLRGRFAIAVPQWGRPIWVSSLQG